MIFGACQKGYVFSHEEEACIKSNRTNGIALPIALGASAGVVVCAGWISLVMYILIGKSQRPKKRPVVAGAVANRTVTSTEYIQFNLAVQRSRRIVF